VLPSTPKFKSSEFKAALAALKEVFDTHSLGIVLLDAIERKSADQIFRKNASPSIGLRAEDAPKQALCGHITGWFFASDDVAYQVIKELDRSCQKERHIVASIPEAEAPERVGSYRAIALKRERAKFVWALARDDRATVRRLSARIINEFFREVADVETARAITRGEGGFRLEDVELAKRIQAQAEQLSEASTEVSDLQTRIDRVEAERARLVAEIGSREKQLRQAVEAREGVEGELKRLKAALSDLEADREAAERARESERQARALAEELQQKVRRLEKLAAAADALGAVEAELDAAKKRYDELQRQTARAEQAARREREDLDRERQRLRGELDEARDELHRARQRLAALEARGITLPTEDRASDAPERVVLLLDQANLAATAFASHGRKVNFAGLLPTLAAGRVVERAVAFVVDNGGTNFDGFCESLRRAGWDLRIKKPKRFADGTTKADWDMGIAMEAVEWVERTDRLVLVSGDGDFAPLLKFLKRRGRAIEVASFPEGLSGELPPLAERVHMLDRTALE
jgi:archaellum component FlaC